MDNKEQEGRKDVVLEASVEAALAAEETLQQRTGLTLEQRIYDENGKLTYEGMQAVLAGGGSVMYGSRHIWRVEDLPTKAQLAKGDKVRSAQAAAELRTQIAALEAQVASISQPLEDTHPGHTGVHSTSVPVLPEGTEYGVLGEGDTAGADGEMGDPESPAGKKLAAQREAAAQAVEDQAAANEKAASDAKKKAEGK